MNKCYFMYNASLSQVSHVNNPFSTKICHFTSKTRHNHLNAISPVHTKEYDNGKVIKVP